MKIPGEEGGYRNQPVPFVTVESFTIKPTKPSHAKKSAKKVLTAFLKAVEYSPTAVGG